MCQLLRRNGSDWANNCPEYKITAVQVERVTSPSASQTRFKDFSQKPKQAPKPREAKLDIGRGKKSAN